MSLLELLLVVRGRAVAARLVERLVLEVLGDVAVVELGRALDSPAVERVPIGLEFSKPVIVWQPKQPSRLIVRSPTNSSLSGCVRSVATNSSISDSGRRPTCPRAA